MVKHHIPATLEDVTSSVNVSATVERVVGFDINISYETRVVETDSGNKPTKIVVVPLVEFYPKILKSREAKPHFPTNLENLQVHPQLPQPWASPVAYQPPLPTMPYKIPVNSPQVFGRLPIISEDQLEKLGVVKK